MGERRIFVALNLSAIAPSCFITLECEFTRRGYDARRSFSAEALSDDVVRGWKGVSELIVALRLSAIALGFSLLPHVNLHVEGMLLVEVVRSKLRVVIL